MDTFHDNPCPAGEALDGNRKVHCRLVSQISPNSIATYEVAGCQDYKSCDVWRRDKEVTAYHRRQRRNRAIARKYAA